MVTRLAALLLALIVATPALAQEDEEAQARKIDERWSEMVDVVRTARRQLGEIQLRYSGAEDPKARKAAAQEFASTKEKVIAQSKAFLGEVDAFLQKFPDNIPIRERRLSDTLFDAMDSTIKAKDAKKLWELTSNNEYLHTAADHFDKAYDFETSAPLWQTAAESAPTEDVFDKLGKAYMNINEFEKAKAAFQRALDAATADRGRRVQTANVKFADEYIEGWKREQELRKKDDNPIVEIETSRGKVVVELFEDEAPNTVASFINLVEQKFFDNTAFFRCMAYFMVQGGCPEGTGRGGPGYALADEHDREDARMHFMGSLSTANQNKPNTNGSQFFITNTNTFQLNGRHTVFGRVLEGVDVAKVKPLDATNKAKPFLLKSAKVIRKRDHAYTFEKLPEGGQ